MVSKGPFGLFHSEPTPEFRTFVSCFCSVLPVFSGLFGRYYFSIGQTTILPTNLWRATVCFSLSDLHSNKVSSLYTTYPFICIIYDLSCYTYSMYEHLRHHVVQNCPYHWSECYPLLRMALFPVIYCAISRHWLLHLCCMNLTHSAYTC